MDPEVGQRQRWVEAFTEAQHALPVIKRDKRVEVQTQGGGTFTYDYADLATILEMVNPILVEHGLTVVQDVVGDQEGIGVMTRIYHKDGWCEKFGPMFLFAGEGAQTAGSAITYARRYALTAALGIATETDDDAISSYQSAAPKREVTMADPHCPACLEYNGELVALDKSTTRQGKIYWRCANRGRDCAGFTESGDRVYSLSLWVEGDDDPDDWKALSDRWLRGHGIFPLSQGSVGPEVVVHVRNEVLATTGTTNLGKANAAVYAAVEHLDLAPEILEKGEDYEDDEKQLKAVAMAIPMELADEWIAMAAALLLDVEAGEEE